MHLQALGTVDAPGLASGVRMVFDPFLQYVSPDFSHSRALPWWRQLGGRSCNAHCTTPILKQSRNEELAHSAWHRKYANVARTRLFGSRFDLPRFAFH